MKTFQKNRIRALVAILRNQGILESLKIYNHKTRNRIRALISDWVFESRFASETRSIIPLSRLKIESENKALGVHYEPTRYFILKEIFDSLNVDFSSSGFVDFGSGKGRALIFAADCGFRKVTGVEFSRELCKAGEHNIERYAKKTQSAFDYKILNSDAEQFEPHREDNVFFFFNPFGAKILTRVLDNIDRSLERTERESFFIYVNPVHKNLFARRYREIRAIENHEEQYNAIIYKKELP